MSELFRNILLFISFRQLHISLFLHIREQGCNYNNSNLVLCGCEIRAQLFL
jgi:hypothetical protein